MVTRRGNPVKASHPLVGKFVQQYIEDRWRVSRFDADLGNGLFLMRHFGPRKEAADLGSSYIINLASLVSTAGGIDNDIYDSWEDFWEDNVCHCDRCKGEQLHPGCPHCDGEGDEEEELVEDEDKGGGIAALGESKKGYLLN